MNQVQWKMTSVMGDIYLVASTKGLCGVYFKKRSVPMLEDISDSKILKQTAKELTEYFAGKRTNFSIKLDFEGTDFQQKVWRALMEIPYGETISYKSLASNIKNVNAIRAAGTANGRNPISIIIPCH